MLMSAAVSEFFSQPKIYNVYHVPFLTQTHQEIIGFDVSMNEVTAMDVVYPTDLW